jgi:hypothetical protein
MVVQGGEASTEEGEHKISENEDVALQKLADRVYQLMLDDLRLERARGRSIAYRMGD